MVLQIGNAVPPPMARAIGHEIKKCVLSKPEPEQVEKHETEVKDDVKEDKDVKEETMEEGGSSTQ